MSEEKNIKIPHGYVTFFRTSAEKNFECKSIKIESPGGLTEITREEFFKLYPDEALPRLGSAIESEIWKDSKDRYHRNGGPAITFKNGDKSYYHHGSLHRLDGPASDWEQKAWALDGKSLSEEKFNKTFKSEIPGGFIYYEDKIPSVPVIRIGDKTVTKEEYFKLYPNGSLPNWLANTKNKFWMNRAGQYHRLDGPSYIYSDGDADWYKEGKLHREDGPAIDWKQKKEWHIDGISMSEEDFKTKIELSQLKGEKIDIVGGTILFPEGGIHKPIIFLTEGQRQISKEEYWKLYPNASLPDYSSRVLLWKNKENQYHRLDGLAVRYANGDTAWYKENKLHREDGPAIEYINGEKRWYKEGDRHRDDGPAVEYSNNTKVWYLNDKELTQLEFDKQKATRIAIADGVVIIYANGTTNIILDKNPNTFLTREQYFELYPDASLPQRSANNDIVWETKNGTYHRLDGPAIKYASDGKFWYKNGKCHREDGPAIDLPNGQKEWYQDDKRHRADGPAIEYANGSKKWYLNGTQCTEEEFDHLNAGGKIERYNGYTYWRNKNGQNHREKGPAIFPHDGEEGDKFWWHNGRRHREDGPAIESIDGSKEYWRHDIFLTEDEANNPNLHVKPGGAKVYLIDGVSYTNKAEYEAAVNQKVIVNPDYNYTMLSKEGVEHIIYAVPGAVVTFSRSSSGGHKNLDSFTRTITNGDKTLSKEEYFAAHPNGSLPVLDFEKTEYWYDKNNKYHRIGAPAIKHLDGQEQWYVNGMRHREDGPQLTYANGSQIWYQQDKLHREDGPAIEWIDGVKEWHIKDIRFTETEFKKHMEEQNNANTKVIMIDGGQVTFTVTRKKLNTWEKRTIQLKTINSNGNVEFQNISEEEYFKLYPDSPLPNVSLFDTEFWHNSAGDLHRKDGPAIIFADGLKKWYVINIPHRTEGPAVEYPDGRKEFWLMGKFITTENNFKTEALKFPKIDKSGNKRWFDAEGRFHRDDGPAIEYANGDKHWYKNGLCHRADGPAVEDVNEGKNYWYLNGGRSSKEECLHISAGGKIEKRSGSKTWYNNNGKLHRENGPAIEYTCGDKHWYQNGQLHRLDGPAIELGAQQTWYKEGKLHREGGPAYVAKNRTEWYKDDKLHREDGPAIESDGRLFWALDNKYLSKEEFEIELKNRKNVLGNNIVAGFSIAAVATTGTSMVNADPTDKSVGQYLPVNGEWSLNPEKIEEVIRAKFTTQEPTFFAMTKDDIHKTAYRVAGKQLTSATKACLIKLLKQQGLKKKELQALALLLEDEVGESLISYIIGIGLTHLPSMQDNPRAQTLAKEFRVNAMATAGNAAFNGMIGQIIKSLPAPTKLRVPNLEVKEETLEEENDLLESFGLEAKI